MCNQGYCVLFLNLEVDFFVTKNRIFTVFSHFPEEASLFVTGGCQAPTQNSKPPKKALRALCTSVLTLLGVALPSVWMV